MAVSCRYSLTCCWLMSHDLVSGWDMATYIEAIDSQFFLLKGSILDLLVSSTEVLTWSLHSESDSPPCNLWFKVQPEVIVVNSIKDLSWSYPIKNCFESLLFMIHSIIRLLGCILVIWFWLTYLDYCKIIFLIEICVTIVIEFNEFCIKIYSHNFILIDTFTWLIDLSDFHHTLLYLLAKNW